MTSDEKVIEEGAEGNEIYRQEQLGSMLRAGPDVPEVEEDGSEATIQNACHTRLAAQKYLA